MDNIEKELNELSSPTPSSERNSILQQIMNAQDVNEMLVNVQHPTQERREELANARSTTSSQEASQGDSSDVFTFSAPASQIMKIMMTPATEALPLLKNITQDLKPVMSSSTNNSVSNTSPPSSRKRRAEATQSSTCIEPLDKNYSSLSPVQTLYQLNCWEQNQKTVDGIVSNMESQYNYAMHALNAQRTEAVATVPPGGASHATPSGLIPVAPTSTTRLHVYLIPQEKGRSKNFDYVGGTVSEDPNSDYYVFCRGRPTVVPFAIGVVNGSRKNLKLKVQVLFTKMQNKIPIRCSKHKEGDNTVWRDQLVITTDPRAQSLSYQEGHGFVIQPVPELCDLLFLCRNSCRQGVEKEWTLQFSLVDHNGIELAVRRMTLRVCEVPHRDIVKSKVTYEWNPHSTPEHPRMRILPCKEDSQIETGCPRDTSDVYPIYVSGYDSYCEIMQYVSNMEMRKKHENPAIYHAAEHMRDWNRTTPIVRFLQSVCGVETPLLVEKFNKKNIRTLGDLYHKFTPDFFVNLQVSAVLASQLSALYLNWRNIIECYEMYASKELFKF